MIKQNHTPFIAQTTTFADVENAESQGLHLSYLKFIGRKKDEPTDEKKLRKTPLAVRPLVLLQPLLSIMGKWTNINQTLLASLKILLNPQYFL